MSTPSDTSPEAARASVQAGNAVARRRAQPVLIWSQVFTLYRRELRGALRDRTIVFNSLIIPVFLYPFLLWALFSGILFVMGQKEGKQSRVAVADWPADHPGLRRDFRRAKSMILMEGSGLAQEAAARIREGELDVLVQFEPGPGDAFASGRTLGVRDGAAVGFVARLTFDQSKDASRLAKERVESLIEDYRAVWLDRESRRLGIGPSDWEAFVLARENVASSRQMGTFLLGLLLPVVFVVMVAVGCFYPAVDTLAGERERGTWETLSTTAASRLTVVVGKYLFVTTMGGVAGALNVTAVLVTARPIFAPVMARAGETLSFAFPLAFVPVLALVAVLLAGFIAAGMMVFASFARTFKEGQSMITPFYLLIMLPIVFLQVPGLKLTLGTACVPVVNLTLLVREAVSGSIPALPAVVAIAVSVLVISVTLRLATFILLAEDVSVGAFNGSFGKFVRQRLFPCRKLTRIQP